MNRYRLITLACLWALASAVRADWVQAQWEVMGTRATLEFWPAQRDSAQTIAAVQAEFERLNALLSPWREDSELYRANHQAAHSPVPLSEEFVFLIERARHFHRITDGAFDVTVAAAGLLYDYREGIAPDDDALAHAMAGVGMDKVVVTGSQVHFTHPATRVDLGGIAKGYAIDRAVALLRADGITHAYVSLGGDSYALGDRRGRPWQVGIRHPRRHGAVAISLPLDDVAISTSGDYERFFVRDGQPVHHILRPDTGRSASGLVSVTILTAQSTDADALGTGIFVLGAERGLALANRLPGVSAILIDHQGEVYYTDDLMAPE